MSDTDGKKTLGLRGGGSRSGQVKQSFSHGRTKNVVVETKRKRVVVPKPGAKSGAGAGQDNNRRSDGITESEMQRRLKALQAAKAREAEDAAKRAADEKAREEERLRRRQELDAKEREEREREAALKAKAEEEERKKREAAEAAKRSKEERQKPAPQQQQPAETPAAAAAQETPAQRNLPNKTGVATPRKVDREREDNRGRNKGRED
ncbi:MAG: translation initiation factor IF-2 associated domain-containing protein, partial [Pseudomonadota bacterium]